MKNFPFPLRFSIPGSLLIFGAILCLFSFNQEVSQSYQRTEEDTIREARFSANHTSGMLEYVIRKEDIGEAELVITKLGGDANLNWAILYDDNNKIIATNPSQMQQQYVLEYLMAKKLAIVEKVRQTLSGQVMVSPDRKSVWSIYPVLLAAAPGEIRPSRVAILLLEYDLSKPKRRAYKDALKRSLESTTALALFCTIVWLFFDATVTKRAAQLVAASKTISQGNLSDRIFLKGSDELSEIAAAFDRMADKLQTDTSTLLQSEEHFRTLVANIPGAVYRGAWDSDWTMEFISDAIAEITGYHAADFIHNQVRCFASIIHPEDREMVEKAVEIAVAKRQHYVIEYRLMREDGSILWVYEKGQAIFDENGEFLWLYGTIFDVSDRKQAEVELHRTLQQREELAATATAQAQQLEKTLKNLQKAQAQLIQTEKMSSLGQLVAGIAHEINNPASFIYGNLEPAEEYIRDLLALIKLYQQGYTNSDLEVQQFVEKIDLEFLIQDAPKVLASMKIGAERIRKIILTLRNFSRLDEAKMKRVNIHDGIDSTLLILQNRLKSTPKHSNIEVIKQYGELPEVECYPSQLNQVFINILNNAIDALHQDNTDRYLQGLRSTHGQIIIKTKFLENDWISILIQDNGYGIDPAIKSKLFEPFFTTKPIGKGTGLGLSISYEIIVEQHGGSLEFYSELGKGAEFLIKIPIKQRERLNFNTGD